MPEVELEALAEPWVGWMAQALFAGKGRAWVAEQLEAEGLTPENAQRLVHELAASPAFRGLMPVFRSVAIRRKTLGLSKTVARIPPDPALYRDGFASTQAPVVLVGATAHWQAHRWTWEALRERARDRTVQVTADRRSKAVCQPMIFGAFLDLALDPTTGDDVYITATDEAVGVLGDLLEDAPGIPGIAHVRSGVGLWIGGAGTVTPLHFDRSTTLLAPVLGKKRVVLVPPEADVRPDERVFWAQPVDLADPDLLAREVVIGPGDALSVPAGWWHHVETLEPCVLVTMASLDGLATNRFDDALEGYLR